MSLIARFAAYAAAFEKAYVSDDWSEVETFFSEDAVYEIGLPILGAERCEGRAAVVAWFPNVLDRLDRRFASRELKLLEGPKEDGNEVWLRGTATYQADGVPEFVLELEETLRFDGELIVLLEDRYSENASAEIEAYASKYGKTLGIELAPPGR